MWGRIQLLSLFLQIWAETFVPSLVKKNNNKIKVSSCFFLGMEIQLKEGKTISPGSTMKVAKHFPYLQSTTGN